MSGGGGDGLGAGAFQADGEAGVEAQAGAQAPGARAVGGQRHAGVGGEARRPRRWPRSSGDHLLHTDS